MTPLICPLCRTVSIVDTPPKIGEPLICPCVHRPPFTSGVALARLQLPEGYELVRVISPPASTTIEHVQV